jgi:hypothetical protein
MNQSKKTPPPLAQKAQYQKQMHYQAKSIQILHLY